MYSMPGKFVLIGQGQGDEWVNILVVIVMAVFWAVGGVIKARAEKQKTREKIKSPAGRRPKAARTVKPQTGRSGPMRSEVRPKIKPVGTAKQVRPSVKPTFDRVFLPERQGKKVSESVVEPLVPTDVDISEVKAVEAEIASETELIKKDKPAAVTPQVGLNLDDSEQLRKAIIYHEVFGKCVGLREQTDLRAV